MQAIDLTVERQSVQLESHLATLGAEATVTGIQRGPVVDTYYVQPNGNTRVSKLKLLSEDIARCLHTASCRVIADPEEGVVKLEVAKKNRETLPLGALLACEEFVLSDAALPIIVGRDVLGRPVVEDLADMPHLLVAGTTGSGKSVFLNGLLLSLLRGSQRDNLRLLLIDPKRLEFNSYNALPHMLLPTVTDPNDAIVALRMLVREMEHRYTRLERDGVRNIAEFNEGKPASARLPYVVCVVDEFADLMATAGKQVEAAVQRLAQMARAAGIHIVVATQRPSVGVITGAIKANIPARLSFRVASKVDSRVILDRPGAESLLGKGDGILTHGADPQRVHGAFVTTADVEAYLQEIEGAE